MDVIAYDFSSLNIVRARPKYQPGASTLGLRPTLTGRPVKGTLVGIRVGEVGSSRGVRGSVSYKFLDLLWLFDGKLSSGLRHRVTLHLCRCLDHPKPGRKVGSPGGSTLITRRKNLGAGSYSVHTFQTRLTQSFPSNSFFRENAPMST